MYIKFRAWHKAHKEMCKILGMYTMGREHVIKIQLHGQNNMIPINCVELMQSTGAIGKKRKEIFEGDIFSYHFDEKKVGIVKYGEYRNTMGDDSHGGHIGFYVDWNDDNYLRKDLAYWVKVSEVIGNIYQNSKLLEI